MKHSYYFPLMAVCISIVLLLNGWPQSTPKAKVSPVTTVQVATPAPKSINKPTLTSIISPVINPLPLPPPKPAPKPTPPPAPAPAPPPVPPAPVTYPIGCRYYLGEVSKYNWNVRVAMAIMQAESSCNPDPPDNSAINYDGVSDYGLFQLHGIKILTPADNIAYAYFNKYLPAVTQWGNGFHPWNTYTSGAYLRYLQ